MVLGKRSRTGGPSGASRQLARRKLDFAAAGMAVIKRQRKQTFASKVKKVVLRNAETKLTNGATKWFTINHNAIPAAADMQGVIGATASKTQNGAHNLLYCETGSLPYTRDGEKIYCKDINVQVHLQAHPNIGSAVSDPWSADAYFRIVVYECDKTDNTSGTLVPPDLFGDSNLGYVEVLGSSENATLSSQGNLLSAVLNRSKYRILRDSIVRLHENQVTDPSLAENVYYNMPGQLFIRMRIPVNKNVTYAQSTTNVTQVCPERVIGIVVVAHSLAKFGPGSFPVSLCKINHQMSFKDI